MSGLATTRGRLRTRWWSWVELRTFGRARHRIIVTGLDDEVYTTVEERVKETYDGLPRGGTVCSVVAAPHSAQRHRHLPSAILTTWCRYRGSGPSRSRKGCGVGPTPGRVAGRRGPQPPPAGRRAAARPGGPRDPGTPRSAPGSRRPAPSARP